jgi:Zn-dependent protease with chaperone function
MKTTPEIKRVKSNARHFTKKLLLEYAYCLSVFFVFIMFPWHKKQGFGSVVVFSAINYTLVLLAPTAFNIYQMIIANAITIPQKRAIISLSNCWLCY